jgi:diamine N-acetyltransferase
MDIKLTTLSFKNYEEVLALKPRDNQKTYVEDWATILAFAYIGVVNGLEGELCIITCDDKPVGRVLIGKIEVEPQEPEVLQKYGQVWRVMGFFIDEKSQGKGIGSEALKLVLNKISSFPDGKKYPIALEVEEANENAKQLYQKLGFYDTGVRYGESCAYVKLPEVVL